MSATRIALQAEKDSDRGRVTFGKVSRYWAGKRPDALEDLKDDDLGEQSVFTGSDALVKRTPVAAAVIVKKADPRLARLANTNVSEAREESKQRHRRDIQVAEVVQAQKAPDDEEANELLEDVAPSDDLHAAQPTQDDTHAQEPGEEDIEAQRRLRREKAQLRQRALEAEAATRQEESSSESESEENSDYGSDESDEEEGRLAKPVFVAKMNRDTILERERLEKEEELRVQADKVRKEQRKKETSSLVAQLVDADNAAAKNQYDGPTNNPSDIDTEDDDAEEEYTAWQKRELARIKKEKNQREARSEAIREREMLAGMTEEEREAYAQRHRVTAAKAARGKMGFLQKYYHKGAFFQDNPDDERGTAGRDPIFARDFNGATGEDKFDRQALPAVMQVKNFGRAGRTKWTHLANEDTTQLNGELDPAAAEFADTFSEIQRKMTQKGGGMMQSFTKPRNTRT